MAPDQTRLGRPATGLPRYYMDCGWYRHPRFIGLPVDALFVFEAAVGYCTQHGTNGAMPADTDDLAHALGLRAAVIRKAVPKLLDRQALIADGDRLHVRSWADHNPTAEEVVRRASDKAAAGSWGNHKRWHLDRGLTLDTCHFCVDGDRTRSQNDRTATRTTPENDRSEDRTADRSPDEEAQVRHIESHRESHLRIANASQTESHGMGWDGK